jgi:ADP-heptose:LPS heptosyltransferase
MALRILIIKLGALGDFVQALGPIKAIRNHHPKAHITLLTTEPFAQIAQRSGYIDDLWIDDRPKIFQPMKWLSLRARLNKGGFDRVYDLQNNDRTSFYFTLFQKKPEWVGIAKGASHRNTSPLRTASSGFDGHVQTLGLAGIQKIDLDTLSWVEADHSFDDLKKPYVLLVAGSAANHPEKRWPAENYAALARYFIDQNIQPVLIGSKSEHDILKSIEESAPQTLNLCEQTSLFDIVVLARESIGAIGNDTGPMHMIAPTGVKTLVLFSAKTNPKRHSPKGKNVRFLQVKTLPDLDVQSVLDAFKD